jgi:transcriptional regulator with XRE-family HTH domain
MGQAIREARQARGLTLREVARRAGADVSWLSRVESGSGNPAWGTLKRIAAALDMRASQLALRAEELEAGRP